MGLCGLALLMLVCSMGYGGQVKARPRYTFYDSPFSTSPAHFLLAEKKGNSSSSTSTSSLQLDGAAWASMPGGPGRWTLQDDDEGTLPGRGAATAVCQLTLLPLYTTLSLEGALSRWQCAWRRRGPAAALLDCGS